MTDARASAVPPAGDDEHRLVVPGTELSLAWWARGPIGELEVLGEGSGDAAPAVAEVASRVLGAPPNAGTTFHLAADHPADAIRPLPEAVANLLGFGHQRDLFQMRRSLPVPADHPGRPPAPGPAVRAADPESAADLAALAAVNNRAFAGHPEQGGETEETLRARMAEAWFDPAGLLLVDHPERPGELAAFCWTKVHPATEAEPELGEIHVIGVDPDLHGRALGAHLTLAGLDHLAAAGIRVAVLYVDAENLAAIRLYRRLGFEVHQRRRVYSR